MSPGELCLERLGVDHDFSGFACGIDALDQWLRHHALAAQQMDSARTFVVVSDARVVGYVSLIMGSVQRPTLRHVWSAACRLTPSAWS